MKSFLFVGALLVTPAVAHAQGIACDTSNECARGAYCIASQCFQCAPSPNLLPQMFAGMMIGAGIGWIVSSVIDAVFLARPPERTISSAAR